MQLVYLSPVPWKSFAQRPHKFVEWFHNRYSGDVLWVDPYPTRFPRLSDFDRSGSRKSTEQFQDPSWIVVLGPGALPIEPIPLSGGINGFLWHSILKAIALFANRGPTVLVIGKPSVLALRVMQKLSTTVSVYDAMDDFPSFYSGLSRLSMRWRERKLVDSVTHMLVSSTALKQRWSKVRSDVKLVLNGLDAEISFFGRENQPGDRKKIFGYAGTMGAWFDWEWLVSLANSRPNDRVRLIGPVFFKPTGPLPENIDFMPPCSHKQVLQLMQTFDVGLIPFKKNSLTASVDPIKYYEYRAFGLPVICTEFGEMIFRRNEDGIYLSKGLSDISELAQKALAHKTNNNDIRAFMDMNSWSARFASVENLLLSNKGNQ